MSAPISMKAPRGRCGRWHNGNWYQRWYNALRGRKAVYICVLLPQHYVIPLKPPVYEDLPVVTLPSGNPQVSMTRRQRLAMRFGLAPAGSTVAYQSIMTKPAKELGHRYRFNRYEML